MLPLPGQVSTQLAVILRFFLRELNVDVMDEADQSPFVFVLMKTAGEGPHDGLSSQHVLDEVLVLDSGSDCRQRFRPVYRLSLRRPPQRPLQRPVPRGAQVFQSGVH